MEICDGIVFIHRELTCVKNDGVVVSSFRFLFWEGVYFISVTNIDARISLRIWISNRFKLNTNKQSNDTVFGTTILVFNLKLLSLVADLWNKTLLHESMANIPLGKSSNVNSFILDVLCIYWSHLIDHLWFPRFNKGLRISMGCVETSEKDFTKRYKMKDWWF